ncbi:MAG: PD-(D/E)XK nuclease family protein, partial [Salinibacterium sp.]|nr:PD-(D/E)XK nuclease family protein [Salinibacterium sp.]
MPSVSISQVQSYLFCPLKFRFQYVDKLAFPWRPGALAFGTSIHAAVEWFLKELMAGRFPNVRQVQDLFRADWYAQNLEPLVFAKGETEESLADKGAELLALFLNHNRLPPVAVEERFEIELADPETGELLGTEFRGYMDCVEEGPVLVELKTAARAYDDGSIARHLQLSAYALVVFLKTGVIPELRLDVLVKTRLPRYDCNPTTRTVEDLAWTARLLDRVARAIDGEHFFPNPSWRCTECEFFAACQQ